MGSLRQLGEGFSVVLIWHRNASKADFSHTRFMRPTEQAHHDAVVHLWYAVQCLSHIRANLIILFIQRTLESQGLIYRDTYASWYSLSDECFYTDTQISRTTSPSGEEMSVSSIPQKKSTNSAHRFSVLGYLSISSPSRSHPAEAILRPYRPTAL